MPFRCLTAVLVFALAAHASAFEIIAHRGASHDAPENTIAALNLAWQQNADAAEFDIFLSKDGEVVLLHDANLKRTTGRNARVSDLTLAELRRLDAGAWKGKSWRGERIPTLSEAIATAPQDKRLFIEFKCGAEALPAVGRAIAASGNEAARFVLIGFDLATMTEAKRRHPDVEVYWLVSPEKNSGGRRPAVGEMIAKAKQSRLDGLFLNHRFAIDAGFVAQVKDAGLRIFAWTVNDAATARRLKSAGVEGVGTDRPGWLRERLE